MRKQPVEVVRKFLQSPPCKVALSAMIAADATFVAADGALPTDELVPVDLNRPEQLLLDTAVALLHGSASRRIDVVSMFGAGGNVAAFGTVTEVGISGEDVTTLFSLWVKVTNGRISHMQYLDGCPILDPPIAAKAS